MIVFEIVWSNLIENFYDASNLAWSNDFPTQISDKKSFKILHARVDFFLSNDNMLILKKISNKKLRKNAMF